MPKITVLEPSVTIRGCMKEETMTELQNLADKLLQ
jgi:hypothetical protein